MGRTGIMALACAALALAAAGGGGVRAQDGASSARDRAAALYGAEEWAAARAHVLSGRPDDAIAALVRVQGSPALGGRAGLESIADLDRLATDPRWEDILQAAEAAAYPCRADETARAFDFWVGEWAVFANGQRAGTNRVEVILEDCVLLENWTNVRGRQGKSFNWVDRSTHEEPRWRQLWVDDSGNTLDYVDGALRDGAMRFSGHTVDAQGDTVLQKLTLVPVHTDTVRQIFEQSTDAGTSWQTTWEGLYVRIGGGG